ncbi:MAG: hypothetical protein EXR71_04040 [Myxococcales bacterium]|nr:hypothetical protein [Myxococcales bacterium]
MRVLLLVVAGVGCAPVDVTIDEAGLRTAPTDQPGELFVELPADEEEDAHLQIDPGFGIQRGGQAGGPTLLADSVAEFSDEQGKDGWSYGYVEPARANSFVPMNDYVAGGADPGWYAALGGVYWTMADAETMHPNGTITTGGRQAVEQWAVRRWTSEVSGEVRITGHFAKLSVDGTSNGVAGYIFIDGVMSWAWYLEGWDDTGIDFDKVLTVAEGSDVDIVIDPWEGDDRSDRSVLTAQVWTL